MDKVRVSKVDLLQTLKANRDSHRKIFLEAQEGYRNAVVAELDKMLTEAKQGKRIRRSVALVEPVDQTREYDRAIQMLEWSLDNSLELDEHTFRQFVLDDWNWKHQFLASNSTYSKTADDFLNA